MIIDSGVMREVVSEPWYTEVPLKPNDPNDERALHVLKIPLEGGITVTVQNTDFTLDNPSLAIMAYLGVRPSTLDEAVGESLPVVATRDGWVVADFAAAAGRRALDSAVWAPTA